MSKDLSQALEQIYGAGAPAQFARYQAAIAQFHQMYRAAGPLYIFRAPGRVNLIGEHTDYNHGFVMPAALDKDILLLARPRTDDVVNLANVEGRFAPFSFTIEPEIAIGAAGHWGNYVRGAAQVLTQKLGSPFTGLDGVIAGAAPFGVPVGAGLSSSSALTVAAMTAFNALSDARLPTVDLVQLCSDAEWYVGTRGGIMDQFVALLAQRDHALFLDCRPDDTGHFQTEAIPLPTTHRLLIVNSGVHHSNTRNEFNLRVAAGRAGVALLQRDYPHITHLRDVQEVDWAALEPRLPELISVAELQEQGLALGDIPGVPVEAPLRVRACCRHVWSENRRVLDAVAAMRSGNVAQLGALMDAAHASARDDYAISCPEIEVLVAAARQVDGVAGARLTGAGWGGCMVALVATDATANFEAQVDQIYRQETGRAAQFFACQTTPGAGVVWRQ
ncbi:MAG: galactokinase [Caldilineaceae bacterium]